MSYINQFNESYNNLTDLQIASLTPNALVASDSQNYLVSANVGGNFSFSSNTLNLVNLNGFTTDNLAEGKTNLYFTNTRARQAISGTLPINYSSSTGIIALDYNTTNLQVTANQINTIQNINITASPTFNGLTLNTGFRLNVSPTNGYILRCDGLGNGTWQDAGAFAVTSITGTLNQIAANSNYTSPQTGAITLSLPQDISTTSNLTFNRIRLADGTASVPSYSFTNSTNSGMYLSSTNQVSVASNGIEAIRCDASGNVVIPNNLTVNGTTTTVNSTVVEIKDNIITLAAGSTTDSVDSGVATQYGSSLYGCIYRIAGTSNYTIRTGVTSVSSTISSGSTANFIANNITGTIITGVQNSITTLQGLSSLYSSGMRFTTSPTMGYVLQCADSSGTFQWSSLDSFGVSSINASVPLLASSSIGAVTLSLDYNTTNLKLTSNKLNTIQDIATTSSPTFAGLTVNGTAYATSVVRAADTYIDSSSIEINNYGTGDRYAYIDFHADNTYVDYNFRVLRDPGANGNASILNRGTGGIYITAQESGPIIMKTTDTVRLTIAAGGDVTINNNEYLAHSSLTNGLYSNNTTTLYSGSSYDNSKRLQLGYPQGVFNGNGSAYVTGGQLQLSAQNVYFGSSPSYNVAKSASILVESGRCPPGAALVSGGIQFLTGGSGTSADATSPSSNLSMYLNGNGNLGIPSVLSRAYLHAGEHNLSISNTTGYRCTQVIGSTDQRLQLGSYWEGGVGQYSYIQSSNGAETGFNALLLNPGGGNVGIGTTTPGQLLEVGSGGCIAVGHRWDGGVTTTPVKIGTPGNDGTMSAGSAYLQFQDSATTGVNKGTSLAVYTHEFGVGTGERVRFAGNGYVGIGTTTPGYLLDVKSSIAGTIAGIRAQNTALFGAANLYLDNNHPSAGDLSTNMIQFSRNGTVKACIGVASQATVNDSLIFTMGGTSSSNAKMCLTPTGYLGIGTDNPGNILQVGAAGRLKVSNGQSDYSLLGTQDADGGTNTRIVISGVDRGGTNAGGNMEYCATASGNHIFYTTSSTTEKMRINSTGSVGIGTSSPDSKALLELSSTSKGLRFMNMTTTQKNAIGNLSGNVVYDSTLGALSVNNGSNWLIPIINDYANYGGTLYLGTSTSNLFVLGTNGISGITIDTTQTTQIRQLQVNNGALFSQIPTYGNAVSISNSYSAINSTAITYRPSANASWNGMFGQIIEVAYVLAGISSSAYTGIPSGIQNSTSNVSLTGTTDFGFWTVANSAGSYIRYSMNFNGSSSIPAGVYQLNYQLQGSADNGIVECAIFLNGNTGTPDFVLRSGINMYFNVSRVLPFTDYFTLSAASSVIIRWTCSSTTSGLYYSRLGLINIFKIS